jgi:hypothetical protein
MIAFIPTYNYPQQQVGMGSHSIGGFWGFLCSGREQRFDFSGSKSIATGMKRALRRVA